MDDTNTQNSEIQKDNLSSEEKKEEASKPAPPIPQKVSKIPAFVQQNHFGKWGGFNNFSNNKQRPGRAASRWR